MEFDKTTMDFPKRHLLAAFLSMEPPQHLITLTRKCGGGSITLDVQQFIWTHCINRTDTYAHEPYLKSVMKNLIREIESTGGSAVEEFYERYACYMVSVKEDGAEKADSWVVKCISFLFNDSPREVLIPLRCSLNMLQGDTGCALWPSSLFLSEFILSFPEVFTRKSCFEVGSGVGLVGICLQHAKASQVILTDGDASTLENLKVNLEMNKIGNIDSKSVAGSSTVQCVHLPWESARESELQQFMPDIVLGADVIYDPSCIPHLVRVLTLLLQRERTVDSKSRPTPQCLVSGREKSGYKNDDCVKFDKAQVLLTDADESTLANLKVNLEMNKIGNTDSKSVSGSSDVQCVHLPWESVRESELQQFIPDIVLGADVIYDPSCIPHLVRVLTLLLQCEKTVYSNPEGLVSGKEKLKLLLWNFSVKK